MVLVAPFWLWFAYPRDVQIEFSELIVGVNAETSWVVNWSPSRPIWEIDIVGGIHSSFNIL